MRAYSLRSKLLPLCAAFILPISACGDDSTPGTDTTDTVQPDTTDTVQPDTTDTVQPDSSETTQPDTTDTTEPDPTDTTEPDTTDTTEPDTTDTTEPDTTDTTEPDTTDTTEPDTTDTTEPDTTDTTEPDTTPASLATLLAPFAGSANNFETTPGATVAGLVVTLVKPDIGTELGGFFAVDPSDMTPVFFAPAAGAAGVPAAGSIITVKVDTLKNVAGVPMVTAFSNLNVTSTGADLDALATNIDAWTAAEYADSQSTYIDLSAIISGGPTNAGGGSSGYQKFEFTSDGLTAPNPKVQLRVPVQIISALAIESGCIVTVTGGAVWGFRTNESGATVEYQPMVVDSANLTVICDAPTLTGAATDGDTTVILTFSRPLDPTTVEAGAFTFEPALTVNSATLSENGKTVTLTTATHEAASYTVTVDETVTDILGAPIDPNADTFTFSTGTVAPVQIVGWSFGTDALTLASTSGIAANAGKLVSSTADGVITQIAGNTGEGLAATLGNLTDRTGWQDGSGTKAWVVEFSTLGHTDLSVAKWVQRSSNTGPRNFRIEYSLDASVWTPVAASDVVISSGSSYFTFGPVDLPAEVVNQATVYLRWVMTSNTRVNAETPVASTGTSRIDEILIVGTPVP